MLTQRRINLMLLAVVLTLGALLLFEPGKDRDEGTTPLTGLSRDQISRILRNGPDGHTLALERKGEGWAMLTPYRVAADDERVQGLLAIAGQPSHARFPAARQELAGFGLDPPAIRLELEGEQLGFGRTDPVYFRRYVLYRDEVHLIDDHGYRHLIAAAESFVSRRPVPPGAEILAIIAPQAEPTDARDQRALVKAWQQAQALAVRQAPPHATGAITQLRLSHGEPPLRFLQAEEHPDLLIRPDLGLAYRLSPDSPLLQALRAGIEPRRVTAGDL